jgi:hypothetical protein
MVLFFLVFSPTINIVLVDEPLARGLTQGIAGVFAVLFMLRYRITPHGKLFIGAIAVAVIMVMLIEPFVTQEVVTVRKLIGILIVALLIPAVADNHPIALQRFLVFTLVVNMMAVVLQLAGNTDLAYRYITYENDGAYPVDLVALSGFLGESIPVGYLPQLRPSGVFPSPTYLSLTLILLWYSIASAREYRGRMGIFAVGVLGIMSGSSVGLFLALVSVLFLPWKGRLAYAVLGAALTMWAYATLLPWQFEFNFNVDEFLLGFTSRLDLDLGGESIIQQRPFAFAAGVAAAAFAVLFARRLNLFSLGRTAFVLFFPVLLHDVGSALLYWTLVSLAIRSQTSIRLVRLAADSQAAMQTRFAAGRSPG